MRFARGLAALDYEEKASLIAHWQSERGLGGFIWGSSPERVERFRQELLDGGLIRVELKWKSLLEWASGCKSPTCRGQLEEALLATAAEALGLQHVGSMSDRRLEAAVFESFVEMQCKQLELGYQDGVRQDPRFEVELRSRLDQELTALANLESRQVQKFVVSPQSIVRQVLRHLQDGRLMELFHEAPTMFGWDASLVLTHVARTMTQMVGLRLPAGVWQGLAGLTSPVLAVGLGVVGLVSEVLRSVRQVQQERRHRWAVLLVSLGYLTALQRGVDSGWWTRLLRRCLDILRGLWRRLFRLLR